jgi:TldD protein
MKRSLLLVTFFLFSFSSIPAQNKILLSAMKDELTRSAEKLRIDNEPAPYYISYLLLDLSSLRIAADSGAITVNTESRNRMLKVDLRVGSYAQDNSNFQSPTSILGMLPNITAIPLDDDYDLIRMRIWLATDRAYKNAIDTLTKKKAALQNTVQSETLPDFTKGEALSSLEPENSVILQKQNLVQLVDQLSKKFLNQQGIQNSKVELTVQVHNSYYVSSEGATSVEPASSTQMIISAGTQATDGMPLNDYRVYTAALPQGLPSAAILEADVQALISGLLKAQSAPVAADYSGPVLFTGEAAGELFGQGFAKLLTAKRLPSTDSPQSNAMMSRLQENPFMNRMNMKVTAGFLSLKALPNMKTYNQKPLLGSYKMDEEGVFARDVSLIENGLLKNLLLSRTPVKGLTESNGHARGGVANPSVLQVISTNRKPFQELKQALINAAKEEGFEFGYIIRGITPPTEMASDISSIESRILSQSGPPEPTQFRLTKPYSAFRVYADGREELVRGLEFGSININALKNVIATSDDEFAYDFLFSGSAISFRPYYATVITPSLLIGGIDLKKSIGNYPKLPIVPYPAK